MLILAWPALTFGIAAFLYGLALFMQRTLYEQVTDRLPLRALAGGVLVSTLLVGWAGIARRADHPGKYGTLFDFSASSTQELERFDAMRRLRFHGADGKPREEIVPFRRDGIRMVDADNDEFRRASSDYMTVALLLPEPNRETPTRFVAPEVNGVFVLDNRHAIYREESGRRTISDENPTLMNVPSLAGALGALALNVLHIGVWFVAFWPILRFTLTPALVLTLIVGAASMFVLVPVLFQTLVPQGVA